MRGERSIRLAAAIGAVALAGIVALALPGPAPGTPTPVIQLIQKLRTDGGAGCVKAELEQNAAARARARGLLYRAYELAYASGERELADEIGTSDIPQCTGYQISGVFITLSDLNGGVVYLTVDAHTCGDLIAGPWQGTMKVQNPGPAIGEIPAGDTPGVLVDGVPLRFTVAPGDGSFPVTTHVEGASEWRRGTMTFTVDTGDPPVTTDISAGTDPGMCHQQTPTAGTYAGGACGTVAYASSGATANGAPLADGDVLARGETIALGPDARLHVLYPDGSEIRFGGGSRATMSGDLCGPAPSRLSLHLVLGTVWAKIEHALSPRYEVETDYAVAGNRGTIFQVSYSREATTVKDLEGGVWVRNTQGAKRVTLNLTTGQTAVVLPGKPPRLVGR